MPKIKINKLIDDKLKTKDVETRGNQESMIANNFKMTTWCMMRRDPNAFRESKSFELHTEEIEIANHRNTLFFSQQAQSESKSVVAESKRSSRYHIIPGSGS